MNESQDINNDFLYEPLLAYKNRLKALHKENSTKYIEDLITKSNVNILENEETVKIINKKKKENEKVKSLIAKKTALLIFLISIALIALIISIYGIYLLRININDKNGIVLIPVGLVIFIIFLTISLKSIKPKLKVLKANRKELEEKISRNIKTAYEQVNPLNSLFTKGMSQVLFKKTLPLVNLDKLFDSKRLDYLVNKFGLYDENDIDRSTLYCQSGDINGNPFFISKDLVHTLGEKKYSGSITIHWTTTSRNSKGQTIVRHHTQVLTAHVTKPCPYYNEQAYIVYGNEAAPDLKFKRVDSDAENLEQKQIDKHVNKEIKKLNKKAEKMTTQGKNYTVLANSEFEVLWGATNRNNEVQFRLLFTPLAQKQLLQLMKDKEYGYGDDFNFIKDKMINYVIPEHFYGFNFDPNPDIYYGYDINEVKERFINIQDNYFKSIYFGLAPILSIPLYQHQQPREYIYKDLYDSYVSFYEHENVANKINQNEFAHPLSKTRNILKTSVVKSENFCDTIEVKAYGYDAITRVDYVTKFGGDGRSHIIPVEWIEYIPVEKSSMMNIDVVNEDSNDNLIERLKNKNISKEDVYDFGLLLGHIIK